MDEITYNDSKYLNNPLYIDVRAPLEYAADHIPDSINIPIFDNEERSEIGKIYRLSGKDDAVVRGSEIAGSKIGRIISSIKNIHDKDIIIYCFRGGMRSTSIVSLLSSLEFKIFKLRDGYKGYRKYIIERLKSLQITPPVFMLHGLTGTGKTEIIKRIAKSIDLELLAGHRSSVFGGLGLKQNTQKMFESLLLNRIENLCQNDYILIEGESRKIGNLFIPDRVLAYIYDSPSILIEAPIEKRVEIILNEYDRGLEIEEVISIVHSLANRIGNKNVSHLIDLLKRGDLFEFVRFMLQKYYDPLYEHSLKRKKFIARIENNDHDRAAEEVKKVILRYLIIST